MGNLILEFWLNRERGGVCGIRFFGVDYSRNGDILELIVLLLVFWFIGDK